MTEHMGARWTGTGFVLAALVAAAGGCREELLAPANGTCPAYCPPEQLQVIDSILLDNVVSDSSYAGYVYPYEATALQVYRDSTASANAASRAVLVLQPYSEQVSLSGDGTNLGTVLGTDSFVVDLPVRGRNPGTTGIELAVHRIPVTVGAQTTFAELEPYFADSTLLALVPVPDSLFSDRLTVPIDGSAFPDFGSDGNRIAIGVTMRATNGYVLLGSLENQDAVEVVRHVQVDSAGESVPRQEGKQPSFDSFVGSPIPPAGPDERDVGGTPAARTMLRFTLPPRILDSARVLRATLILVPTVPILGAPGDSLVVVAHGIVADVGAKSPLVPIPSDSLPLRVDFLAVGVMDTARLDVTDVVIGWVRDSTRPRTLGVRAVPEGGTFAMLRSGAASSGPARPRLEVTFVPRLTLGGR